VKDLKPKITDGIIDLVKDGVITTPPRWRL